MISDLHKTNICCLDLTQDCIDYLKSLDLNVYVGSLGSVFSINWGRTTYGHMRILSDVNIPVNLHEYHVFIHDMENPHNREYLLSEHQIKEVENTKIHHLEISYPINVLDLRPFGLHRFDSRLEEISNHARIEILFVGHEKNVEYHSNVVEGGDYCSLGSLSNIKDWHLVYGKEKCGVRVRLEDSELSKHLFESRLNKIKYYRIFSSPTVFDGKKQVPDNGFISFLSNESGDCISYGYFHSEEHITIVLPQVEDKAGLLKDVFEFILFRVFSNYFPDIESRNWIKKNVYQLPEEIVIQNKIDAKREELKREIERLEQDAINISEKYSFLKQLLKESGSALVTAVKCYLEWLGFENVVDKDETLKKGELKEEDLCFCHEGIHVIVEVKGINHMSTDSECCQIDKIVTRRMRQLDSTKVHGIYIVNNQRNVEPLKRQTPPFNDNQIKDAESQGRTMIYTAQLFALYSDIENGYITKEDARMCFMKSGLVDFHNSFTCLGRPYRYLQNDTVVCFELNGIKVSVGDILYYKDSLERLVSCKIDGMQVDKDNIDTVETGKVGVKLDQKIPRNREFFISRKTDNSCPSLNNLD